MSDSNTHMPAQSNAGTTSNTATVNAETIDTHVRRISACGSHLFEYLIHQRDPASESKTYVPSELATAQTMADMILAEVAEIKALVNAAESKKIRTDKAKDNAANGKQGGDA